MLIPSEDVINTVKSFGIDVTGVLHIGAHECEERVFYHQWGLTDNDIIWVDAMESKVAEMRDKVPHIYQAVITDKDDDEVTFNVANNGHSSSVLEFGTHAVEHPHVVFVDKMTLKTTTVNTFIKKNNIDCTRLNFWNIDIQGAEMLALKGALDCLPYVEALFVEVNEKELYRNCAMISEIDEFLLQYGCKRVLTHMTRFGWGDALYVKVKPN